jgi:hypothetical protein
MKCNYILLGFIVICFPLVTFCQSEKGIKELKGPYLGQKPPGLTPELFAPGIISTGYHDGCITFSPDGKELFYHFGYQRRKVILYMEIKNNKWTAPQVAPFSGKYREGEPHFSPDGNIILFSSNRPLAGKGEPMTCTDIWMVKREKKGWGEPWNPGPPINSEKHDLYPTLSKSGDLYFASDRDGVWDIYVSKLVKGGFAKPEKLGPAINSEFGDWDACLAPDESYIIFGSNGRSDGLGESDLYISFRGEDGAWSPSKHMGSTINTKYREVDPVITPDGKYIFFRSNRRTQKSYSEKALTYEELIDKLNDPGNGEADIYWVSAKVIESLRPNN